MPHDYVKRMNPLDEVSSIKICSKAELFFILKTEHFIQANKCYTLGDISNSHYFAHIRPFVKKQNSKFCKTNLNGV